MLKIAACRLKRCRLSFPKVSFGSLEGTFMKGTLYEGSVSFIGNLIEERCLLASIVFKYPL